MKTLVYLESPFQILSYYYAFGDNSNHILFVRLNNEPNNENQIKKTCQRLLTKPQITYLTISQKKTITYINLINLLIKKYKVNNLIVGDARSKVVKLLLKITPRKHSTLVDDGAYLITDEIDTKQFKEIRTLLDKELIKNNEGIYKFTELPKVNKISSIDNLFIGQPLSELKIIERNLYMDILRNYRKANPGQCAYITHRRETLDNKSQLESMGYHVITLETPVELYLIDEGMPRIKMTTFYSTAIINAKRMNPALRCESINITSLLNQTNATRLSKVYELINNYGIVLC